MGAAASTASVAVSVMPVCSVSGPVTAVTVTQEGVVGLTGEVLSSGFSL